MRLKDKVALVTGGAAGIGLACARAFAAEGAKVVIADLAVARGEAAVEALQEAGSDALFVRCDVGSRAEVEALIASTVAAFGRLDVALANAGIVKAGDFLEFSEEDFDAVLRVNLKGVFLTGQAAARQMVAQGTGGAIINMSSVNAVMAIPSITPYVVAKGGVNQLTKVMSLALADKGIRVNGIGPGSIRTEVLASVVNDPEKMKGVLMRTPLGRVGEPEEIASVAVFLASEEASYITGQTIYPDGGRLALNYTVPVKG
ncbi:NAD(P)-dependent dehydrogenase, short-chain alcohol dehydrogenase family [Tistlia consotensis]|uniref:NAD(P)-dependent dehydrogenase, short-chain alcohol dehydrogenase family n=1 Tax=Tistlia consotensis USBA 355 TaxID=560819 RepID=A0A1Y6C1T6_9PROT|nr:SDR family oxidoreductase [Tistlia consotensis]SMF32067.1 NAD(P)-dependent dehydrogenase, short-chain alcohol dehydrogenase family [Tistlia consotensis USBA 355]SNR68069.1 NAD(P)-dependent dehydrogenase, short-chain alcohol dehydrogenase family [Tistlia consotensis]